MQFRFNAEEWNTLSPAEQSARCRLLAEQASLLANQASPEHAEPYQKLARDWLQLAEDIERAANISSPPSANVGTRSAEIN